MGRDEIKQQIRDILHSDGNEEMKVELLYAMYLENGLQEYRNFLDEINKLN